MTDFDNGDSATAIVADYVILPEYEPIPWALKDHHVESTPTMPAEWFGYHFPDVAKQFGSAMLERHVLLADSTTKIIPLHINEDFFAGMLGTEKCHRTAWHVYERQFYQRNPQTQFFEPVDEGKLTLAVSQWFIKCVSDMPGSVNIETLFTTFRSKEVLEAIIERAKAVLSVGEEFFSPEGSNARNPATTPKESVRLFVDTCLTQEESASLTSQACFEAYTIFCREQKLPAVQRNRFAENIRPHIQRRFNRGVRHDLHRYDADRCTGWRGIKIRPSL
jgi:hypothetical protein